MGLAYSKFEGYGKGRAGSFESDHILQKNLRLRNVELYAYSNLSALYDVEKKFEASYEFAMKAADSCRANG